MRGPVGNTDNYRDCINAALPYVAASFTLVPVPQQQHQEWLEQVALEVQRQCSEAVRIGVPAIPSQYMSYGRAAICRLLGRIDMFRHDATTAESTTELLIKSWKHRPPSLSSKLKMALDRAATLGLRPEGSVTFTRFSRLITPPSEAEPRNYPKWSFGRSMDEFPQKAVIKILVDLLGSAIEPIPAAGDLLPGIDFRLSPQRVALAFGMMRRCVAIGDSALKQGTGAFNPTGDARLLEFLAHVLAHWSDFKAPRVVSVEDHKKAMLNIIVSLDRPVGQYIFRGWVWRLVDCDRALTGLASDSEKREAAKSAFLQVDWILSLPVPIEAELSLRHGKYISVCSWARPTGTLEILMPSLTCARVVMALWRCFDLYFSNASDTDPDAAFRQDIRTSFELADRLTRDARGGYVCKKKTNNDEDLYLRGGSHEGRFVFLAVLCAVFDVHKAFTKGWTPREAHGWNDYLDALMVAGLVTPLGGPVGKILTNAGHELMVKVLGDGEHGVNVTEDVVDRDRVIESDVVGVLRSALLEGEEEE